MDDLTGLALFAIGWWAARRSGKKLLPWTVSKDAEPAPEIEVHP